MREWLHQCPLLMAFFLAMAQIAAGESTPSAHWAYQPILRPVIPIAATELDSPIDALITAKLQAHGLSLSSPADRRTLLRRASIDLIGLAPTFAETEAFVADAAPDAFAKVVDRLLASPRYGERWGRHWLDVARFAETKDLVLLFGKDRLQPYAYTYRDYVVRALNLDTPYDRFIQEQIAADQIDPPVEKWRLAALGFLTVGKLFDNNSHDQVDDQIDVVSRGFLGLTVSCARCHNHKYDAIPTEDYYSLYGVFASSERPYDLPLIEDPEHVPGGLAFEGALARARQALEAHVDAQHALLSETARERAAEYLVRVVTSKPDFSETSTFFLSLSPWDLRPGLVLSWRRYLDKRAETRDPVFGLWADLMALPDEQFTDRAKTLIAARLADRAGLNAHVVAAFMNAGAVTSKAAVARIYGELFTATFERHRRAPEGSAPDGPTDAECQLLEVLEGKESPCSFAKSQTHQHMARVEKDRYGTLVRELDKLAAYSVTPPPARAMTVQDAPELLDPHVFVRGNPARLGKAVPRQFLRVLAGENRQPFTKGSGRLELARAIIAPDNPLTSRVMVNRVWMHHFGEPLVSSPSDFGARSDPPLQPELLDYLAWTLMRQGWSLKKLHREIMLSKVYQQASLDRPAARQVDPENRMFWRANRRRLDFEAMRDTMLSVANRLDATMGGRSVDVAADPGNSRRTVYGLVDRQDLPGVYRAFDFACPDQSVERRSRTVVPQQALFAMNSPFVRLQARALAESAEASHVILPEARSNRPAPQIAELGLFKGRREAEVSTLYQAVLSRLPEREELDQAVAFLEAARKEGSAGAVQELAQVLLMSNEFMFVD